jgi:hypothetical protein
VKSPATLAGHINAIRLHARFAGDRQQIAAGWTGHVLAKEVLLGGEPLTASTGYDNWHEPRPRD